MGAPDEYIRRSLFHALEVFSKGLRPSLSLLAVVGHLPFTKP
jgi:hypothetical protein